MAEETATSNVVRFGAFEVDLQTGELRKHGMRIKLQEQPFQILAMLLEKPGALVTREHIQQKLWPADTFVDFDHSVNTAVRRLRDALGDDAETPRFIETLPRRGYRFIGDVNSPAAPAPADDASGARQFGDALSAPAGPRGLAYGLLRARWRWAAVIALLAFAALLTWRLWPRARIESLAVLPFSADAKDDQYLGEGVAQGVISAVGDLPDLRVASANSSFRYAGARADVRQAARELHVAAVLIGTIRRIAPGQTRIAVELVDGRDERHLWGAEYNLAAADLPAVERLITEDVAQQLRQRVQGGAAASALQQTRNVAAYELYLRGRFALRHRGRAPAVRAAATFFQQAIDKDPNYALAYLGISSCMGLLAYYGDMEPMRAYQLQQAAVQRAMQLAPELSETHMNNGYLQANLHRNLLVAEEEFRRALQINPNSAEAHHAYAAHLRLLGRFDEAIAEEERAFELDPWTGYAGTKAWILYDARRYEQAEKLTLSRKGGWPLLLGYIYEQQGRYNEAIELFKQISDKYGPPYTENYELAHAYAVAGRRAEAEAILANLLKRRKTSYELPSHIAVIYAGLGNADELMRWLSLAVDEHDNFVLHLKVNPQMDRYRSDPRFQAILRRVETPE